jgi:hypothetical protein
MQFFNFHTSYDSYKEAAIQAGQKSDLIKPAEYYHFVRGKYFELAKRDDSFRSVYNQTLTEEEWYDYGKPYYNFHPKLTGVFSKTKLNFPAKYLQFPFETLAINFAKDDPNVMFEDGIHQIRSLLVVTKNELIDLKANKEIVGEKFLAYWIDYGGEDASPDKTLVMSQIGLKYLADAEARTVYAYRTLRWKNDETVESAIVKTTDPNFYKGVQITEEVEARALRLIASIAFLTKDESPVIIPHVLNEDVGKLKNATPERRQQLHDKACRRRKSTGYLVGNDQMFDVGHIGSTQQKEPSEKTGRELKFAHIVSGFWKLVRYGPNMEHGRIKWIMPYVRGEGKPFKYEE